MYDGLRDEFLYGLSNFYYTNKLPPHSSLNMRRALGVHKKRLDKKGLTYSEIIKPCEELREETSQKQNNSFLTTKSESHYNIATEISDGTNSIRYDDSKDDIVYLHYIDRALAWRDESQIPLICPNCDHRASAATFANGCPMCGTKFKIDDLYPCVNAYYTKADFIPYETQRSKKKKAHISLLVGGTIATITSIIIFITYQSGANPNVAAALFVALLFPINIFPFCSGVTFAIFGFIDSAKGMAGGMRMTAREVGMFSTVKTKKILEKAICPMDPAFTYEEFEGKIISAVRTIAYSDDRLNCSLYSGTDDLKFMDDIVDIKYRGGIGYKNACVVNGYQHLLVTLYLENIYYKDGQFSRVRENFQVELIRHVNAKTNPVFSAFSINCPNCGASFDSVISKSCPTCGSRYEISGQDWSVLYLCRTN